jgi:ABC-type multidrug transport system ATPase subunit
VRENNVPPIPLERVRGFPTRAAADGWVASRGEGAALGGVHFLSPPGSSVPPPPGATPALNFSSSADGGGLSSQPEMLQLQYVLQSNGTLKYFRGQFQDLNSFFELPFASAVAREASRAALMAAGAPLETAESLIWRPRLAAFPHPALASNDIVGGVLSAFLFAALMFGFVTQMGNLAGEKELGLRQALRTMGMRDSAYWLSWLVFDSAFALVTSLLIVAFGLVLRFEFFLRNDLALVLALFWLFCLAMTAFAYFLSAFLHRSQSAVYAGFAVFLVGWIFQGVQAFVRLPYSPYFYYSDTRRAAGRAFFWVFNLSPWNPLTKGVADLMAAAGDRRGASPGLRWSQRATYCRYIPDPQDQPPYDPTREYRDYDCVLPLSQALWCLAAQALAYGGLAVYLDQALKNELGLRRPAWFFLQPGYWRPRPRAVAQALGRVLEEEEEEEEDQEERDEEAAAAASGGGAASERQPQAVRRRRRGAVAECWRGANAPRPPRPPPEMVDADVAAEEARMRALLRARVAAAKAAASAGGVVAAAAASASCADAAAPGGARRVHGSPLSVETTNAVELYGLRRVFRGRGGGGGGRRGGAASAAAPRSSGGRQPPPPPLWRRLLWRRSAASSTVVPVSAPPPAAAAAAAATATAAEAAAAAEAAPASSSSRRPPSSRRARSRRGDFWAVEGSWLHIREGELFCLLGPNGAGKTTTINCLTGTLPFSGGEALVYGESVGSEGGMERARGLMGVCPQFDVLWAELTGAEHLTIYGLIKGEISGLGGGGGGEAAAAADEAAAAAVDDDDTPSKPAPPSSTPLNPFAAVRAERQALLARVRLTDAANLRSGSYSGGMRRRLSVAVALLGDPKIVYLDEPTTGMDPISRRYVWDIIMAAKQGRAIVLTTHSMEEADVLGDRVAIMARGRLRALGTPLRLKQRYGAGYRLSISVLSAGRHAARRRQLEKLGVGGRRSNGATTGGSSGESDGSSDGGGSLATGTPQSRLSDGSADMGDPEATPDAPRRLARSTLSPAPLALAAALNSAQQQQQRRGSDAGGGGGGGGGTALTAGALAAAAAAPPHTPQQPLRRSSSGGLGFPAGFGVGGGGAGSSGGGSAAAAAQRLLLRDASPYGSEADLAELATRALRVRAFVAEHLDGLLPVDETRAYLHYIVPSALMGSAAGGGGGGGSSGGGSGAAAAPRSSSSSPGAASPAGGAPAPPSGEDPSLRLARFLARLEGSEAARLGVTDVQLSLTSLEDVFLEVARRAELEAAEHEAQRAALEAATAAVGSGADAAATAAAAAVLTRRVALPLPGKPEIAVPLGEEGPFPGPATRPGGPPTMWRVVWAQDDSGKLVALEARRQATRETAGQDELPPPPPPQPSGGPLAAMQRAAAARRSSSSTSGGGGGAGGRRRSSEASGLAAASHPLPPLPARRI